MSAWKNLTFFGLLAALAIGGCTVTTSDDGEIGGFGNDDNGGSDSVGGSENKAGGVNGGSENGGADTNPGTPFTADDCQEAAEAEDPESCGQCIYAKLCDLAVACENKSGCMDAINATAVCVWEKYKSSSSDPDNPTDGIVTPDDEMECAGEGGIASSGEANELWSAICGANDENGNECEARDDTCAYECYLADQY